MTDVIKYLKVLMVQLESLPVLLGYGRSKEGLWTRAVNFHVLHFVGERENRLLWKIYSAELKLWRKEILLFI